MAIPTFYHSALAKDQSEVYLDANEARHARQSRRLSAGSPVRLLNGKGLVANGSIKELSKRECLVDLFEYEVVPEPLNRISVAVAVPKGDRQRFMVESMTQLGVAKIQPLECARSVLSNTKATHKWQRYAIEAIKQSQNPWLPEVCEPLTLSQWVQSSPYNANKVKLVADGVGVPLPHILLNGEAKHCSIAVIGPEGGLTEEESDQLVDAGFLKINLGANILRTEVAAISCVAQWQSLVHES